MGRRRQSLRGALRSRFKLVIVWLFLLGLACVHWIDKFCRNQPGGNCNNLVDTTLGLLPILAAVAVVILSCFIAYRVAVREDHKESGFKNEPWHADKKIIRFYGRVEYVMRDRFSEKMKRKVTDIYRTATNNDDPANRYIHQRFLISSPQLRRGERLLVLHNTSYGSISIRRGRWIEAQGEYVHQRAPKRTMFGKKMSFYGRVHFTHEPKGGLRVLRKKPVPSIENIKVRVLKKHSEKAEEKAPDENATENAPDQQQLRKENT